MKNTSHSKHSSFRIEPKSLTLGDLISATYSACGEQRAPKILQMALATQLVRFKRTPCRE